MIHKLKQLLEFSSKTGLYLPGAYDAISDKPSVSLWFAHISFSITMILIMLLAYKDINAGVIAATIQSTLMLVFYLIRKLSKFKVDLDDREIELDSGEQEDEKDATKR